MLLCKFVRDGLNVRVTSQMHHRVHGEREPVLVSIALLPSPSARPSSSLAIYRDYRPQGRKKERRNDDEEAQRTEFRSFTVATFSSRNRRRAFFSLSHSLSLSFSFSMQSQDRPEKPLGNSSAE